MRNARVRIGNAIINAEVVDSFFSKAKGLIGRKSLGRGNGMLLVFGKERRHAITMFGMLFPIDIIWVGKRNRVVDVAVDAAPSLLPFSAIVPKENARYVLEVDAGSAKRHGIKVGSRVKFKY